MKTLFLVISAVIFSAGLVVADECPLCDAARHYMFQLGCVGVGGDE